MASSWANRTVTVLGQRVHAVVVGLVGAILGVSILAAVTARAGFPLLAGSIALVPWRVTQGFEAWRLVTWGFLGQGINLLFGCFAIWWAAPDLARAWGGARLLRVSLGVVVLSGLVTCLVGLVWAPVSTFPYAGVWPLADALIIAWASIVPYGVVNLFMVLPVPARQVPAVWIGFTVVAALLDGVPGYIPHLLAECLILLYLRDYTLRTLWLRMRYANIERTLRRRASPLREVKKGQETPPRWFH
jgi:hypothetical protein